MERIKNFYKRLRALIIFRPKVRKWTLIILSVILLFILIPVLFLVSVNFGMFGELPNEKDLENIRNNVATEVYTADSVLLGKYYYQNRTNTSYENISPYLINALIATEDARFYKHNGVDLRSWIRVFVKSILMNNRDAGGGSTVSQQLAKNLFGREEESSLLITKAKEAVIARKLENIYSKEEILALYFNTVPFGDNIFGVETAAERYFNKRAKNVNIQEAATLIGMLKANQQYNPRVNPKNSRQRRNVVLEQMAKYEFISAQEADSIQELPMEVDIQIITTNSGLATYFREHLRQEMERWAKGNLKKDGTPYNIYADGLKIYTTLDSKLQRYAEMALKGKMQELQQVFNEHWKNRKPWSKDAGILERAVQNTKLYQKLKEEGLNEEEIKTRFSEKRSMKYFNHEGEKYKEMSVLDSIKHHLMILHAGLIAINPRDGLVKAWVGGIDHDFFKYDHVNINTKRQVGSTFKPIVYTAALQSGVEPCSFYSAEQVYVKDNETSWVPRNNNGVYEGEYSVKGALINSVNTVSVKLLQQAGIDHIINLAKAMGIQSDIPQVPSIALGTNNTSLFEMATAYCTFANHGRPVKPIYVKRITDQHGKVIEEFEADVNRSEIISEETNKIILEMMRAVVNEGTASKLRWKFKVKNDIAGKTGTTQNNADGWFIGISPQLVVGVWVGADDPRIRFRSTSLGQGSSTALPIFANFFEHINNDSLYSHISNAEFEKPSGEILARLECVDYLEPIPEPTFWERLFGVPEETEEEKKEKVEEKEEEKSGNFFKDLFRRKKKDN